MWCDNGWLRFTGEGEKMAASLSNIDVGNFAQREHLSFWVGSEQAPLDHRVDAVFTLLTHIMLYKVTTRDMAAKIGWRT